MSNSNVPNSRRKFLLSIGAGSAVTVAAVVAAVVPGPEVPADDGAKPAKESGYQVSEHINKYYRTTRV
jgi:hypothetical protein